MESYEQETALDARWYGRLEAVVFEDYEKLTGLKEIREREKKLFLEGGQRNPYLDYPELMHFDIKEREEELLSLKDDVLELEQNEAVRKIYRTKINELLATLRMLKAAKEGDDHKFMKYSDFIYGTVSESDKNYIIKHLQELIAKNTQSDNKYKQQSAATLGAIFNTLSTVDDTDATKDILPDGENIEGSVESVEEAVTAFEETLESLHIDDWEVLVDTEKGISNFSVSQEHKTINIPSEEQLLKRNISKKKLQGLIAHEIGTHVARRHNGEHSKLQLLGLGLDRYISGEEGVATYNEQQVTGAKEFAGVVPMISILLAKGIDGQPRDFRDTFELMKHYHILKAGKTVDETKAAETAYNNCVRIFRGSTSETPGAIYTKDMAYFGNRKIWTLVSKNSDVVQQFSIGKYDPTNGEHLALLSKLGILDQDLRSLEQPST